MVQATALGAGASRRCAGKGFRQNRDQFGDAEGLLKHTHTTVAGTFGRRPIHQIAGHKKEKRLCALVHRV